MVDTLPTLAAGECLVVGDAVPLPAVVKMSMPNPSPSSNNVNVYGEWNKDWVNVTFEEVIKRWRKRIIYYFVHLFWQRYGNKKSDSGCFTDNTNNENTHS